MGDRAMAQLKLNAGSLYVYTHWGGYELPADSVLAVLAARGRWSDESYAARIIVDQLTKGGRDGETGYGLMLTPGAEDEYNDDSPSVVIDLPARTLTVCRHGQEQTTPFSQLPTPVAT